MSGFGREGSPREWSKRVLTIPKLEKAERYGGGQDRFCRSALDAERLTYLRQRARSIGEQRKEFEFVSEKYGWESINTENYIPHPSVVRSRQLDVDRSCSSHDYLLRVVLV